MSTSFANPIAGNGAITFNSASPLNLAVSGIGFQNAVFPNNFNCFGGSTFGVNSFSNSANATSSTNVDVCVIGLTLGLVVLAGIGAWVLQGTRQEGGGLDFDSPFKRRDQLPTPEFVNPQANVQNRQGFLNPKTAHAQQPSIKDKLSRAADSLADSFTDSHNYLANQFKNGLAKVIDTGAGGKEDHSSPGNVEDVGQRGSQQQKLAE
jgi:hypothetical protein